MASANSSFDVLASTTLKNYRERMTEQIIDKARLLKHLKESGYVREESGGTTIVEPLLYGENSTVRSYSGYDILDTTPQEGISAAEYEWKLVSGSVSISGEEEAKNMGSKTQIVKLLSQKVRQLEITMGEEINEMLFSDGSGNGGKDIVGLEAMVDDDGTFGSFAGIDSNTYTFWRNKYLAPGTSFASFGVDAMRTMYHNCSHGSTLPSIIITTQTIFERYEKSLVQNERFVDTKSGDAGFLKLLYKATPIIFDQDCTSGDIYFLTKQYLNFVIHSRRNFVMTEFQKPENQDAKVAQLLLMGNLTTNRRDAHGVIAGLSAA